MKFVASEMPMDHRGMRALYKPYIPLVRKFLESGNASARVVREDGDEPAEKFPIRLGSAISHIGRDGDVCVRTSHGVTYLVRVGQ